MNHSEASFHSLSLISEPGGPKRRLPAAAELSSPVMSSGHTEYSGFAKEALRSKN